MAVPVIIVESGGWPVTNVANAVAFTPTVAVGDVVPYGIPITLVDAGGFPVTLVNEDGSAWEAPP